MYVKQIIQIFGTLFLYDMIDGNLTETKNLPISDIKDTFCTINDKIYIGFKGKQCNSMI